MGERTVWHYGWRIVLFVLALMAPAQADRPREPAPAIEPDAQATIRIDAETLNEVLPADVCRTALDELRKSWDAHWMLAKANGVDIPAGLDRLKEQAANGLTRKQLIVELQKIIAQGIDGHATVGQFLAFLNHQDGFNAPFLIDPCGDRFVVYQIEHLTANFINEKKKYRFVPLKEGFPYLRSIDGVPIEKWIEVASPFVTRGSAASMRRRSVEWLHCLPFYRGLLGLPNGQSVDVILESEDKARTISLSLPTTQYAPSHYDVPHPDWTVLDGDVGYLWLRNTSSSAFKLIAEAMPQLRETNGLVIDLRGNGGGAGMEPLQLLAGFLLPQDQSVQIVGVLAQPQGLRKDGAYLADTPGFGQREQDLIATFAARFTPEWQPPPEINSQWAYVIVADPVASGAGFHPYNHPVFPCDLLYHYDRPIVVLIDDRCFSSGEMLIAGIEHLPNVTLVGTPTSGSITSPSILPVPGTGLSVVVGESVFLRTDGRLVDGQGIDPGILIHPDADYYFGRRDRTLERALEVLRSNTTAQ